MSIFNEKYIVKKVFYEVLKAKDKLYRLFILNNGSDEYYTIYSGEIRFHKLFVDFKDEFRTNVIINDYLRQFGLECIIKDYIFSSYYNDAMECICEYKLEIRARKIYREDGENDTPISPWMLIKLWYNLL